MTIFGWDMSHYDAPGIGDAVLEGFSFITHKAGGDDLDNEIAAWWAGAKDQRDRLLLGAYWVLYPGSPVARADAFLARLDATCPGWRDGPFILQADCEEWGNNPSTKPGKADIKAFCDRLRARMPKLTPIVYASAGQYGNELAGLPYPLWNARYSLNNQTGTASGLYARSGGDTGKGWAAYSGQTPAIWQFTSSATIAGQTTSDANAFRGILAQLTALVAPGWSDAMTPDDKQFIQGLFDQYIGDGTGRQADGTMTSPVGVKVWGQGFPDPTKAPDPTNKLDHARSAAWQVIENVGVAQLANGKPDPVALAQALAEALPADLAKQLVDELAQRLSA